MTIGFHNPYLDGFGGGERYTLSLASHWSKNHAVVLFWDSDAIREEAKVRFNIDLSRVKTTQNIFRGKNLFRKLFLTRKYDLIFFLSDGSIPMSLAHGNILHFQVPFERIETNPLKVSRYQAVVCNSFFTRKHLDQRLSRKSIVIYPPVSVKNIRPQKKESIILSVGRFNRSKKLDVLIDAFAKGYERGFLKGWRLLLVGGLLPSDEEYFQALKTNARSLPIEFLPNIPNDQLAPLYGKTSLYWHATGQNETDPQRMEHFGISTVEAMAAGCIPVVFRGGGLPEIVTHGKNGFLWKRVEEFLDMTKIALEDNPRTRSLRREAQQRARDFDETIFFETFDTLLEKIV